MAELWSLEILHLDRQMAAGAGSTYGFSKVDFCYMPRKTPLGETSEKSDVVIVTVAT